MDQDANFSWKTYKEFLTNQNSSLLDESGFYKAVRAMPVNQVHRYGQGRAVLMNLSPQWYNAYRVAGSESAKKRDVFIRPILDAGVEPRVRIKDAADTVHGYEITYWSKPKAAEIPGRIVMFVCYNPELTGDSLGGGNSKSLKTATVPITLQFRGPVHDLRNERSGQELGDGSEFRMEWKLNEAMVVSYPNRDQ